MRTAISIATALTFIFAGPGFAGEKSKKNNKQAAKEYPGQPMINQALKHLLAAQNVTSANEVNVADAIASLNAAEAPLKSVAAEGEKGSTGEVALRLTRQAIKDLEKGLKDGAAVKIEKAIVATRTAGDIGARNNGQK